MTDSIERLDGEGYGRVEGRVIFTNLGGLEAYIPEIGRLVELPLRITHSAWAGLSLEIGPYVVGRQGAEKLRDAIAAFIEEYLEQYRRFGNNHNNAGGQPNDERHE
jgi:hypothetical protein